MKLAYIVTALLLSACTTPTPRMSPSAELAPTEADVREPATIAEEPPTATATKLTAKERFARWEAITTPTKTPTTEIIGSYASGCMNGAIALPFTSPNYILMRPSRNAYFGDASLLKYLTTLAQRAHDEGLQPILIEDLSHPRGGPVAKGHGSHQIGLDVDISLTTAWPAMTPEEHESFIAPSFVNDRKTMKPEWTDAQAKLIALAADAPNVGRIFVSPAIKKMFCETQPNAPWLWRLRPWWGHDDHIHVRLNCPAGSKTCRRQDAVDSRTNGCDADLAWWLSKDADRKWKGIQDFWASGQGKEFPGLPAACEAVRNAK